MNKSYLIAKNLYFLSKQNISSPWWSAHDDNQTQIANLFPPAEMTEIIMAVIRAYFTLSPLITAVTSMILFQYL